jgi:hypothetical protein
LKELNETFRRITYSFTIDVDGIEYSWIISEWLDPEDNESYTEIKEWTDWVSPENIDEEEIIKTILKK